MGNNEQVRNNINIKTSIKEFLKESSILRPSKGDYVKIKDYENFYIDGIVENINIDDIEIGDWVSVTYKTNKLDGEAYQLQGIVMDLKPLKVKVHIEDMVSPFPQTLKLNEDAFILNIVGLKQPKWK